MRPIIVASLALMCSGCSVVSPTPSMPSPPPEPPPLACKDYDHPITTPDGKFYDVGRQCNQPDGTKLWINAFYKCDDGTIWPVLSTLHPPSSPPEPAGAEFNRCVGRS